MISGPGTNLWTRSTINSKILVDSKNKSEFAMDALNDKDTSVPTDVGMFGNGCKLVIQANGRLYINTAADGAAATFVQVGTAPTVLAGDVSGPVGSNQVNSIHGVVPKSVNVFDVRRTTVGGSPTEAFTVTGVLSTDHAYAQVVDQGTGVVTILNAVCTLNTVTILFSDDPTNDAVVNILVTRATGL